MNPALLVLFARAIDLDARSLATYASRTLLVFILIFALLSAQMNAAMVGAPGLAFFAAVGMTTLVFISLVGIVLFATTISEEKEEMTIGLLKMTGLDPVSILLGKGPSRVLAVLLLFLAQFPFTLLAITLGGVSISQVFAAYVTFAAYLLLMGGIGLFSSVLCRRSATAIGLAAVLLFLFLVGPWIGVGILDSLTPDTVSPDGFTHRALTWTFDAMKVASPFVRFSEIQGTGFNEGPVGVQALSNLAAAVVLFLLSWALYERATSLDRTSTPGRSATLLKMRLYRVFGIGRVWPRAIVWKEFHFGIGGKISMLLRVLLIAGVLGLTAYFMLRDGYREGFWSDLGTAAIIISTVLGGLDLLSQAARTFNSEWRAKTLPELTVLPHSAQRFVFEKLLGCLISLIPYALFFIAGVALLSSEDRRHFFEAVFSWELVTGILVYATFVSLSVYMSLRFKWLGLLVALGVYWGCAPILGILSLLGMGSGETIVAFIIAVMVAALIALHIGIVRLLEQRAGE